MSDLVSIRVLLVSPSEQQRDQLRRAAGVGVVPIDVTEAESCSAARKALAVNDFDLMFVDAELAEADRAEAIKAGRAARQPPFVIVVAPTRDGATAGGMVPDAIVPKPGGAPQAERLMDGAIRVRLPSRVLLVDDSSTTRGVVRKLLGGSRFPMEISEAGDGFEALKQVATGIIDVVVVDYNMPGLTGVETVSEIRRQYPKVGAVMMTSMPIDDALSERARAAGAIAILKKPFFASDIDSALRRLYGLFAP